MTREELEAALQALHQEYRNNLPVRVDEIESEWRSLCETWDSERFLEFVRLAHSLKGSGATYGYVQVSEAARNLEAYAKSLDPLVAPAKPRRAQIDLLIAELRSSILQPPEDT